MIRLIDAREELLPQVLGIEREAISPPWSEGALLNEIGREDGLFLLALEESAAADNDIAGFCILRRAADEAELYQIAVRDDCRRRGVGGALLGAALEYCRLHRVVSVYLEVRRSNDAAIRLYKKYGFKNEGRRKNYYSSPVEDAVIMSLPI
ncbi:ribosomal-protein-alanine N-acetyltransferase [Sporobacter termitidis DSM 10068]|uniref:[Ribosomal protein bS18]-alanine N-acetyltransferase n=1 Tax=Sporobacter termitidis DSM 10068 TaxID=1123282 RepID=A0A1M5XWR4_9FIRM|nr:ribosomal protein S18-alanine N-acetyltransferase [Sporobacter termitidis]SHI04275.1 ribosomal-protein-alanine N-acetyltransferase [Sporobacter termitidis DSM 10068]